MSDTPPLAASASASAGPPARVYTLDDHPLYLQGIAAVLGASRGLLQVGSAETLQQALIEAPVHAPDLMLVDMGMPGCDGAATLAALRAVLPATTRLVAISGTLHGPSVQKALAAGACAYLLKTIGAQDLLQALRAVLRGEQVLSPGVQAALDMPVPAAPLTPVVPLPTLKTNEPL